MKLFKRITHSLRESIPSVLAVLAALFIGGILLIIAGHDPLTAYQTLFRGAFGNNNRIAETFVKATPLIIMALGASIAFKAQLWNIGGNGQFTLGAIVALTVGIHLHVPIYILIPVSLIGSLIAGGLLGALVGWLKARFNANEVITTLMFDYIMLYMLSYLLRGPLIDPDGHGFPQTPLLADNLHLPILLEGTRLHAGLLIAALFTALCIYFWRSRLGFEISMVGESQDVARYCGINVSRNIVMTMAISAAFAALAGWVEVFGIHYRLLDDIAGGFGSVAIVVALLGRLNPVGIFISGIFFAALVSGGNTMQRMEGIPYSLVNVLQGLVIVFVISRSIFLFKREKKIV